jgi:hypothetical protein
LKHLNLLRWVRGEHVISVTPRQLELHRQTYCTQQPGRTHSRYVQFNPALLRWKPPPPWKEKKTDRPGSSQRRGSILHSERGGGGESGAAASSAASSGPKGERSAKIAKGVVKG